MQEEEFLITAALIIFLAEFFYWFLTIFTVNNIIDSEALKTATYAVAITFNDRLATYFYVKEIYYILPACLGAFIGSFLAVKCNKMRQKNLKTVESQS